MQAKKGVFLIEVLVFLLLFSFFSILIMKFIATSTITLTQINKKSDKIATLTSAMDWLMRDVHGIDPFMNQVSVKEEGALSIISATERITWKLKNDNLLRVLQRYDTKLNHWKKPYISQVAKNVSVFTVALIHSKGKEIKGSLKGIMCQCSGLIGDEKYHHLHQTIALRNGEI